MIGMIGHADRIIFCEGTYSRKHVVPEICACMKVFARKGQNWIQTIVHISFYWKRHVFTIRVQTVGHVPHCMFDVAATIDQQGRVTGPPRPIHCCCCHQRKKSRGVKAVAMYLLRQSDGWRHKSLYHLRTLIDGQLVPVRGARTLIHAHNSGTTCLRVDLCVPSQKMIPSAWPIIPIILSVRSCYTLYTSK